MFKNFRLLLAAASIMVFAVSCQQEADMEIIEPGSSYDASDPLLNLTQEFTEHSVSGKTVYANKLDNDNYIIDGDILVTKDQLVKLLSDDPKTESNLGAWAWPGKRVNYVFASNFPYRNTIQQAMNIISQQTGAIFVQGTGNGSYINIIRGNGNYSQIGRTGRRQDLSLANNSVGIAIHELGHAMGLHHEHQRPDRDNYLIVNAQAAAQNPVNFRKQGYAYGQFDFSSMMMYPSRWIGNGYDLTDRQGQPFASNVENGTNRFSSGDLSGLSYLGW